MKTIQSYFESLFDDEVDLFPVGSVLTGNIELVSVTRDRLICQPSEGSPARIEEGDVDILYDAAQSHGVNKIEFTEDLYFSVSGNMDFYGLEILGKKGICLSASRGSSRNRMISNLTITSEETLTVDDVITLKNVVVDVKNIEGVDDNWLKLEGTSKVLSRQLSIWITVFSLRDNIPEANKLSPEEVKKMLAGFNIDTNKYPELRRLILGKSFVRRNALNTIFQKYGSNWSRV